MRLTYELGDDRVIWRGVAAAENANAVATGTLMPVIG